MKTTKILRNLTHKLALTKDDLAIKNLKSCTTKNLFCCILSYLCYNVKARISTVNLIYAG